MNPMEVFRQTATGAKIIAEWLGEGAVPVSQELAERRAMTCVCCPFNLAPLWWDKFTNAISETIRGHLKAKKEIGLSVSTEKDLHMCQRCGCALPLKVHVPIHHVANHTRTEKLSEFPSFCWIKNEIESPE